MRRDTFKAECNIRGRQATQKAISAIFRHSCHSSALNDHSPKSKFQLNLLRQRPSVFNTEFSLAATTTSGRLLTPKKGGSLEVSVIKARQPEMSWQDSKLTFKTWI